MTKQYCNDSRCERVRKGEKHLVHDLTNLQEARSNSLEELVKDGAQLAGTGVGTAIGFLIGGPEGAMVGGMLSVGISRALKTVGSEISKRFLSPQEKIRLGAVPWGTD